MPLLKLSKILAAVFILLSNYTYAQKIEGLEEETIKIQSLAKASENLSKTIDDIDALIKSSLKNAPQSNNQAEQTLSKVEVLNSFKKEFLDEKNAGTILFSAFSLSLHMKKEANKNFIAYQLSNICRNMPGDELFNTRFIANTKELDAYRTIKLEYAKEKLSMQQVSLIKNGIEQQITLAHSLNTLCRRVTDVNNW